MLSKTSLTLTIVDPRLNNAIARYHAGKHRIALYSKTWVRDTDKKYYAQPSTHYKSHQKNSLVFQNKRYFRLLLS